jgi:hypothetical protein
MLRALLQAVQDFVLLYYRLQVVSRAHPVFYPAISQEVKWLERGVDNSPQSSA